MASRAQSLQLLGWLDRDLIRLDQSAKSFDQALIVYNRDRTASTWAQATTGLAVSRIYAAFLRQDLTGLMAARSDIVDAHKAMRTSGDAGAAAYIDSVLAAVDQLRTKLPK